MNNNDNGKNSSMLDELFSAILIGGIIYYVWKDIVEFTKFMFRLIWWILRLPIILIKDHKLPKW